MILDEPYRKTSQHLCPATHQALDQGQYDIYPGFPIPEGLIFRGFAPLAQVLAGHKTVVMDGFGGVIWSDLRERLDSALRELHLCPVWYNVETALRSQEQIASLIEPYMGGDDPLFGNRFQGKLADFFDLEVLQSIQADPQAQSDINILYGCGAALAGWEGILVYVDVPKNEIQFRSRAGSIVNPGFDAPRSAKEMYKQFYFVDWVVLNQHKAELLSKID
ncbi:MAG: hypothetical protein IH586_02035, partial [Anaerolineaceae bacterium]|nr:hypothetical protein [Anaerolineaceae bacterium]